MTLAYLWFFLLILTGIWCFFAVARIHAYKFKNMSTHIPIMTNFLFFVLLILSIIWIIMCFFLDASNTREVYIEEFNDDSILLEQEIF
jgi:hypothetical protein